MAKTYEEVYALYERLKMEHEERHFAHTRLRKFWHGRYWENTEHDTGGIASIFRDLTSRQTDIGPDVKLVYNVLKDVCVKFQTYLSPLPQIRCYVDPPSSPTRRTQATTKDRFLYGTWAANSMSEVLSKQGWYLPLMGDCYLGIWPDLDTSICRVLLRSPEYSFPILSYDKSMEDGVIFCWKTPASAAMRAFPKYTGPTEAASGYGWMRGKRNTAPPADPDVEILEYSDKNEFYRWVDGQLVTGVTHNMSFNLFEHVKFINVPDEPWGHGAVEQAVNLVEMGNAYLSLMMQSAIETVFPPLVLENPQAAPEIIERGAGSVIPLNQGGKAYYLVPPSGTLIGQAEFNAQIERMVKMDTSMPDVNFGQASQSVITGKAINELQGAGTGTLVEMVQGVSIGRALASWNEKAIDITRKMFKEDTIRLYGNESAGLADLNPRSFAITMKGKDLVGSTRNEVVFMPYLDMQQKVVIGLQLAGAGVVSMKWQRDNVGIPDSEAMDEEIVSETIQKATLAMIVGAITDPSMGGDSEKQADQVIEGGALPHPLTQLQPPAMPGGAPSGPPGAGGGPPVGPMPGGGSVMSPAFMEPPGAPAPGGAPTPGGAPAPPSPSSGGSAQSLTLDQAMHMFSGVSGVSGRIFLVGEIVQTGKTSDTLDVDLTDAGDRNIVQSTVSYPMRFHVIPGEPQEPFVEVTPGSASSATQGSLPQPGEALG